MVVCCAVQMRPPTFLSLFTLRSCVYLFHSRSHLSYQIRLELVYILHADLHTARPRRIHHHQPHLANLVNLTNPHPIALQTGVTSYCSVVNGNTKELNLTTTHIGLVGTSKLPMIAAAAAATRSHAHALARSHAHTLIAPNTSLPYCPFRLGPEKDYINTGVRIDTSAPRVVDVYTTKNTSTYPNQVRRYIWLKLQQPRIFD